MKNGQVENYIYDEARIYGDGINVAVRLEGIARRQDGLKTPIHINAVVVTLSGRSCRDVEHSYADECEKNKSKCGLRVVRHWLQRASSSSVNWTPSPC